MAAPRWYPSSQELKDPAALERSFRQLLTQHYTLQDQFNDLKSKPSAPATSSPAPASTDSPAGTKFLGLHVAPVDTQTLVDGATLKFNKKAGNFQFS